MTSRSFFSARGPNPRLQRTPSAPLSRQPLGRVLSLSDARANAWRWAQRHEVGHSGFKTLVRIQEEPMELIGVVLAVVALAVALYHVVEIRRALANLAVVQGSVSTQYLGKFPRFLKDI